MGYYESPWVSIVSNYMGTPRGVGVPPTTGHGSQHWIGIGLVLGIASVLCTSGYVYSLL